MVFHFGSFALGFASGFLTAKVTPRLRTVGLELVSMSVRVVDGLVVRLAQKREDLQDLVAEAKARARTETAPAPQA
jgi:hypothetical protein